MVKEEQIENLRKEAKKIINNFGVNSATIFTTIAQYTIKTIGDGQNPSTVDKLRKYNDNPFLRNYIPMTRDVLNFISDVELLLSNYQTLMEKYDGVLDELCDLLKIKNSMKKAGE